MTRKAPKTPEGWACRLGSLLYAFRDTHGQDRFPINVRELALEYSKSAFPGSPIAKIEGVEGEGFEAMLVPIPNGNGSWGIIYNSSSLSKGRKNFSIAHEFGHYLLHRHRFPDGKRCTTRDMLDWNSEEAQIEGEANRFAANLLMPLDDFRSQVVRSKKDTDLVLFERLAARYDVSLSATILRWLGYTHERAMIVVGREGFIDWAWSSKPLLKSGVYFRPKQETIELPSRSLAARRDGAIDNARGVTHPKGVWAENEEVTEMAVITSEYGNMTISLLKYPRTGTTGFYYEEPDEDDVFDRFQARYRN